MSEITIINNDEKTSLSTTTKTMESEQQYSYTETLKDEVIDAEVTMLKTEDLPYIIPKLEKRYVDVNGEIRYIIDAALYRGNEVVASAKLNAGDIRYDSRIYNAFGEVNCAGMNLEAARIVYNKLLNYTEAVYVYEAGGWYGDSFVLGNLKIESDCTIRTIRRKDCSREIPCAGVDTKNFKAEDEDNSKAFTKYVFNNLFNNEDYGHICLVYLILAMLDDKLPQGADDGFCLMLAIIGATGVMKTSTAKAVFNPLDFSALNASFTNSNAAINAALTMAKGNVLIIDDMSAVNAKNKSILEEILREVGDKGSGAKKMSGRNLNQANVSNMVVTGETMPKLQRSSLARMLVLEFNDGTVNIELLTTLQNDKDFLLSFQMHFILFIIKTPELIFEMTQAFKQYRKQLLTLKWQQKRCPTVIAWFMAGAGMINKFLGEEYIDVNAFSVQIKEIMDSNWDKYSVADPVRLYLQTLYKMTTNGDIIISDSFTAKVSIRRSENILIMPNQSIYDTVVAELHKEGYSGVDIISNRKLLAEMRRIGILCSNNSHNTVPIHGYNGGVIRGIKIYKSKLLSYLNVKEEF